MATDLEKTPLLTSSHSLPDQGVKWPQHLASLLASIIAMGAGCVAGWSSPAIPYLQGNLADPSITLAITDEQASWVGSISTLGAMLGALPAAHLSHVLGRKNFLLLLAIPLVLGWAVIMIGHNNLSLILSGRLITGLTLGSSSVAVPLYSNEVSEISQRGRTGIYLDLLLCTGILWVYVVGAFASLFWLTASCALIPVVFVAMFAFMPESPVHLLAKGNRNEAENCLRWLRGAEYSETFDAKPEIAQFQHMIDEAKQLSKVKTNAKNIITTITLRSTIGKAIGIVMGLMVFQRLSGASAVVFYTVDIFRGAETTIAPVTSTIIVGTVSVIASACSVLFVDWLGRRFLLILSDSIMAVSLAVMALYFMYKDQGMVGVSYRLVPIVALCVFIAMFRLGFGPVPWFMMAELLPSETKVWAPSAIAGFTWCLTFIVTKLFVTLVDHVGYFQTYALFATICFCGTIFTILFVPETRNKSPMQIRLELSKPNSLANA